MTAEVLREKLKKHSKLIEIISTINHTDVKHNKTDDTSTIYSNENVPIRKKSDHVKPKNCNIPEFHSSLNKNGRKVNNGNNLKAYYNVTKSSNNHSNFKKNTSFSRSKKNIESNINLQGNNIENTKQFNVLSEQPESKIPKFSNFDKQERFHSENNFKEKIKNKSTFGICNFMSSIFENNVNEVFSERSHLSNQEINKSLNTSQQFKQLSKKQTAKNGETKKLCRCNSRTKEASQRLSDKSSEQNKFLFHHQEFYSSIGKDQFCIPETSTFSTSDLLEDGNINNLKKDLLTSKTCIVPNVSSQNSVSVRNVKGCGASQIIRFDTSQTFSVNFSEQDEGVSQHTTKEKWCNSASSDFITLNQHFPGSLTSAAKSTNLDISNYKSAVNTSNETIDLLKYSYYGETRKTLSNNHSICSSSEIEKSLFPNTSKPRVNYEVQKNKSASEPLLPLSLHNPISEFHLQVSSQTLKQDEMEMLPKESYSNEIKSTESQTNNSYGYKSQIEKNTLQFLSTNSSNTCNFQDNIETLSEKLKQTAKGSTSLSTTSTQHALSYSKKQASQGILLTEICPIELNSSQRNYKNYISEECSFQKSGNSRRHSLNESLEIYDNKSQMSQILHSKITSLKNLLEIRENEKLQGEDLHQFPQTDPPKSSIANSENKDETSKDEASYIQVLSKRTSPSFKVHTPTHLAQELIQKSLSSCQDNIRKNVENHLDDELVKILKKNFQRFHKLHIKDNKIDGILQKMSQNESPHKNDKRTHVKKYRKNMEKIYKLKGIRKKKNIVKPQTKLTCKDVQIALSKGFFEPPSETSEKSSYLTTNSSYKTDETTLEIISNGSESTSQKQVNKQINSEDRPMLYGRDHNKYIKNEIKEKIQKFLLELYFDLKTKGKCVIRTRKQTMDNCFFQDGRLQLKPVETAILTEISSSLQRSKAKFKLFLITLEKIHSLLENNIKITKREFYYQMKNEIDDQWITDKVINSVSCLLNVGMWELNIFAQKGLVFGNLTLRMTSGEAINCNVPGTLIPSDVRNISEIQSTALFILVVEKESIFHKLIEEDLPNKLSRPFILITGKGFPDLNTQLFLKKLWMVMSIPVFILVDADPHGIKIMLNYRFGSVSHAHVSQHLTVPSAKWLGVYPSEIKRYKMISQPLTDKEIKILEKLLKTPYIEQNPDIGEEVKTLLKIGAKASIEGLLKSNSFLSENYLANKFYEQNFI